MDTLSHRSRPDKPSRPEVPASASVSDVWPVSPRQSSVGPAKEDSAGEGGCPCGSALDNPNYPVCSECWYQTSASIRYAYVFKKNRRPATLAHLLAAAAKRKRTT